MQYFRRFWSEADIDYPAPAAESVENDPKLKSPALAEAHLSALAGISALCFYWVGYDLAGIR